MSESKRMGTCDIDDGSGPHVNGPFCVNWREPPEQPLHVCHDCEDIVGGEPAQGKPHCVHCGKPESDSDHAKDYSSIIDRHPFDPSPSGTSAEQFYNILPLHEIILGKTYPIKAPAYWLKFAEAYAKVKVREAAMRSAMEIYYQRGRSAEWSVESLAKIIEGK